MTLSPFLTFLIYAFSSYHSVLVIDLETGKPISGCHILSDDGSVAASTDMTGKAMVYCRGNSTEIGIYHLAYLTEKIKISCSQAKPDTIFLKRKIMLIAPVVVQSLSPQSLIQLCLENAQETYGHKVALGRIRFDLTADVGPFYVHRMHGEVEILTTGYAPPTFDPLIRFSRTHESLQLSPFVSISSPDQEAVDMQILLSRVSIGNGIAKFSPTYFLEQTIKPKMDSFRFVADTSFDGHPVHFLLASDSNQKNIDQIRIFLDVDTKGIIFFDRKLYTKKLATPFFEETVAFRKLGNKLYPMYNKRVGLSSSMFSISLIDTSATAKPIPKSFKRLHQTTIADIRKSVMSSKLHEVQKEISKNDPIDTAILPSARPLIQKLLERSEKSQGERISVQREVSYPLEGKKLQ